MLAPSLRIRQIQDMRNVVLVLILLAFGCAAPDRHPPSTITIDPALSAAEQETIRSTVDAWCDAVGWCPTERAWTGDGEGRFELVDDLSERDIVCPEGMQCEVAGRNNGERVAIAANRTGADDMALLWVIVAHEIGHFCHAGHVEHGLMSPYVGRGSLTEIDAEAVRFWDC
jgi:hypothetical protein